MSEYLSEEEQLARMRSWWGDNGTTLVVAVVVGIAAIVGWRMYESYQQDLAIDGARAYAEYQAAQGDEKSAVADQVAADFAGSIYHSFVLLEQAQTSVSDGDLAAAEAQLEQVVDSASDDLMADLARIRLAKVLQASDRSSEALTLLDGLRNAGYRSWALETKGDIHMASGEIEQAYLAYQAATESLDEGDARPMLKMKLDNAAPVDGEYVAMSDALESALREAAQTLTEQVSEGSQVTQGALENAVDEKMEEASDTVEAAVDEAAGSASEDQ